MVFIRQIQRIWNVSWVSMKMYWARDCLLPHCQASKEARVQTAEGDPLTPRTLSQCQSRYILYKWAFLLYALHILSTVLHHILTIDSFNISQFKMVSWWSQGYCFQVLLLKTSFSIKPALIMQHQDCRDLNKWFQLVVFHQYKVPLTTNKRISKIWR